MKRKGSLFIAIICIGVGILINLQMKSLGTAGIVTNENRAGDLSKEVATLKLENDKLSNQLKDAEEQIKAYEKSVGGSNTIIEKKLKQVEDERLLSGLVSVRGEGLIITVDTQNNLNDSIAYKKTADMLLLLINELNSSGAEAISVNNERLINTTEIRQAGSYININRNKVASPFEIKVIGNPDTLNAAINMRSGVADILRLNKLKVTSKKMEEITINAYSGEIKVTYAKPVDPHEGE